MLKNAQSDSDAALAKQARLYLEQIIAIDSASDERSESTPSTEGQTELANFLGSVFSDLGATITRTESGCIIASLPGQGEGTGAAPIALMIHLDTAEGTHAIDRLEARVNWDGTPLSWPKNEHLEVSLDLYPSLSGFVGHTILHGRGDAPIGLDDKLGLAHMMSLAWLLAHEEGADYPPLLLVGRPDEEIGRDEDIEDLARELARRGVTRGYTIDGIAPFEVNLENFNASGASLHFPSIAVSDESTDQEELLFLHIRGVNTHGATAHAEGHCAAPRLVGELLDSCNARALFFRTDPERDCDAEVVLMSPDPKGTLAALDKVLATHQRRGARWEAIDEPADCQLDLASDTMLRWVHNFLGSDPGFTLAAEDSSGRQGYSQPFRSSPDAAGQQLDIRVRDFSQDGLRAREQHILERAPEGTKIVAQYSNMGSRLAEAPELQTWATRAAQALGSEALIQPIRGGTGIDPFLDQGIAVGNLGTGYFAPESEKEFTSVEQLVVHARWLRELISQTLAST